MRQMGQRNRIDQASTVNPRDVEPMPDAAGFWRRLTGFVVDMLLCFGIPSLGSSMILLAVGYSAPSVTIDVIWMIFLGAVILAYFTFFALRGASPGMRVAGIKVVQIRTGNPPDLVRSLIRASLILLLIGSWFILLLLSSSRNAGGMSKAATVLLNVDYVVFLVSFFGHVWIAWDRKRQTLQDKVAGVLVVHRAAVVQPVERPARTVDPLKWRM